MLPLDVEFPFFLLATLICFIFGTLMSRPSIFKYFTSFGNTDVYLKAGEYGETELENKWSIFKEPLNSWTSLFYSLFGIIMLFTGIVDLQNRNSVTPDYPNQINASNSTLLSVSRPEAIDFSKNNLLANYPSFSIVYGLSAIYLGVSSFLFHASHCEVWRKADAGMTSGVVVPLFALALWDKLRPPALQEEVMILFSLLVLVSFTHGYLPYGSSDVLLPSLVAFGWTIEFLPRYGGAVDNHEYIMWGQCAYVTLAGVLLRAADIKRKAFSTKRTLLLTYFALTYAFSWLLGNFDVTILVGAAAGLLVTVMAEKGHIFWHLFSAFALYKWWHMMRTRPDTLRGQNTHSDVFFFTILLFIFVKNAWRRIFMNMPVQWFKTLKVRNKVFNLSEHVVFSIWGWIVIVMLPTSSHSWLYNTALFWVDNTAQMDQASAFHFFYIAKVATHIEDLLYLAVVYFLEETQPGGLIGPKVSIHANKSSADESAESGYPHHASNAENTPLKKKRDILMDIHHVLAALLCIASYATGYVSIGSVVMLLHDISDIPLAFLIIFNNLKSSTAGLLCSYIATLLMWLYWRLWILPSRVLYSILFEVQRSNVYSSSCDNADICTYTCSANQPCSSTVYFYELIERTTWTVLVGGLLILHLFWFKDLLGLGYKEIKKL